MPRRLVAPALVGLGLVALGLGCFGRLALDPSALIVDADRPSLDHDSILEAPVVGNDATRLFLPHHLGIADHLARLGHVPAWDDRGFGGRPLVGNPQAGLFYPPTWVAWWTARPAALGWITAAHLLVGGLGAYRLARTLGLGEWAALVAAGCFQASPYVLAQVFEGHYPHVWATCWYPWAFEAMTRARRGDLRAALGLAPILAATFLAGHPQEGYYLLLALGFWLSIDIGAALRARRSREASTLGGAGFVVVLLVLGLIGVEVVPDSLAQAWGLRWRSLPLRLAGQYHLDPINAIQLLGPRALGGPSDFFGHDNSWETLTSIGLVPLLLAAIGAARHPDRRAIRGWLTLVALAVVFASGRKLGLFALLYEVVPGMDRFRVPARSLFLASLGATTLAGYGVDALREGAASPTSWGRLPRRVAILALVLALVVLAGRGAVARLHVGLPDTFAKGQGHRGTPRVPELDRWLLGLDRLSREPTFWLALGGSTVLMIGAGVRPGWRRGIAPVLGVLGLVELGLHGHALLITAPADRFLGPDPIAQALAVEWLKGHEPGRIRAVDALYDDLRAGRAGLAKTNVNDSFQIQHAADLYEPLYRLFEPDPFDRDRPMDAAVALHRRAIRQGVLDRMAVTHLVTDRVDPDYRWPTVASGFFGGKPCVVRSNPTAMPRAYVVPRAHLAADDASTVALFPAIDPHQAALMPTDPLGPDGSRRQPYTPAQLIPADPDHLVIRVETAAPGLLVVADTWMPGWTATINGRSAPVLRANRAQRVVPLPDPGRLEIVLIYRPPGFALGLSLTAASALIWSCLFIAASSRGRLRPPPAADTDPGPPPPR